MWRHCRSSALRCSFDMSLRLSERVCYTRVRDSVATVDRARCAVRLICPSIFPSEFATRSSSLHLRARQCGGTVDGARCTVRLICPYVFPTDRRACETVWRHCRSSALHCSFDMSFRLSDRSPPPYNTKRRRRGHAPRRRDRTPPFFNIIIEVGVRRPSQGSGHECEGS